MTFHLPSHWLAAVTVAITSARLSDEDARRLATGLHHPTEAYGDRAFLGTRRYGPTDGGL